MRTLQKTYNGRAVIKRKSKGLTLVEAAIVLVLMSVVVLGAMKIVPNIQFSIDAASLQQEVNEVRTAAVNWKATRPNYTGLAITDLCTAGRQLLNVSTCGTGNNGQGAAPWGGNYTVAPASDPSFVTVSVTGLPNHRVLELADTLAPMTAERCTSADSCSTAVVTGASAAYGHTATLALTF
ncbi:prepilin-type N-terminal cleavage/methylation domain-containing protein [Vibrio mediterranei]|uniref:prepilin-type N-terminal cleavage/methylation domain-containing protein n=1 Tax=Vibrio mediterranei TaxID=689 RepID=UPI00406977CC